MAFRVQNLGFPASWIHCSSVDTPVTVVKDLTGRILVFAKIVMLPTLGGAVHYGLGVSI